MIRLKHLKNTLKNNYMLVAYYIICIIYCFYQLNKKYNQRGLDYASPEMDAIMVLIMASVHQTGFGAIRQMCIRGSQNEKTTSHKSSNFTDPNGSNQCRP